MILWPYWSVIEQLYCVRELVPSISWCKPSSGVKVMVKK